MPNYSRFPCANRDTAAHHPALRTSSPASVRSSIIIPPIHPFLPKIRYRLFPAATGERESAFLVLAARYEAPIAPIATPAANPKMLLLLAIFLRLYTCGGYAGPLIAEQQV